MNHALRKHSLRLMALLMFEAVLLSAQRAPGWRDKLDERLSLFGHRNWIVIADSAYPLQSGPGIETVLSSESQIDTVRHVLQALSRQSHIRPVVYTDQELRFVSEADAPGIAAYRQLLDGLFEKFANGLLAHTQPHEAIIRRLDEAGRAFNVFIVKTSMMLPYTSVFIELRAGYWTDEAEERLRTLIQSQ